jgi:hypothetical protein
VYIASLRYHSKSRSLFSNSCSTRTMFSFPPLVKNRGDKHYMTPKLLVYCIMLRRTVWQWFHYISPSLQDTGAMYESRGSITALLHYSRSQDLIACKQTYAASMSLPLPLVENSLRSSPMISENGLLPIRCCEAPQSCLSLSISQYVGCSWRAYNLYTSEVSLFLVTSSSTSISKHRGTPSCLFLCPSRRKQPSVALYVLQKQHTTV